MKNICLFAFFIIFLALPRASSADEKPLTTVGIKLPQKLSGLLKDMKVKQFLWVVPKADGSFQATVYAMKFLNEWVEDLPPMVATIGRKGLAEPGGKLEGDGKSPAGVFPLGFAFGYEPVPDLKIEFKVMNASDVWVDDPEASDYNTLTTLEKTKAKSFEFMRRKDFLYKLGIVVEYNTNPVIKGKGSAIFVHIWKDENSSTSGCVAFPENSLRRILSWLDPVRKPHIVTSK